MAAAKITYASQDFLSSLAADHMSDAVGQILVFSSGFVFRAVPVDLVVSEQRFHECADFVFGLVNLGHRPHDGRAGPRSADQYSFRCNGNNAFRRLSSVPRVMSR